MNHIDRKDWKKVTFGNVCQNLNVAVADPEGAGIERYVGLEHIEPENLHVNAWGNVADGTTFTKTFKAGQVLFGKRRAYQKKAALADFDGVCSGDILVLEANEKLIDPKLLPFVVSSDRFFEYAVQTSAGSLSPRTKFQDLAKFEFLLPPKDQQAKLAELLWAGDEVSANTNDLVLQLRLLKMNFLDCWINEVRKDSDTVTAQLDQIGSFKNGVNKSKDDFGFGHPFVNLMDVFGHDKIGNKQFSLVNVSESELRNFNLKKGDILFVRSSVKPEGVGLTAIVSEDLENTVYSGFLIRFRQEQAFLTQKYLQYCFYESNFRRNLIQKSTISANTNINQIALGKLELPIPSVAKQGEFAKGIDQIEKALSEAMNRVQQMGGIQKKLINEIFSE